MPLNPPIQDWRGRRVWIIGASSGIGEATARTLLERGARVALSARSQAPLQAMAAVYPEHSLVLPLDITAIEQLRAARGQIEARWQGIDLAIVAAGTHQPVRVWQLDAGRARALFEVNLMGVLAAVTEIVPVLLGQRAGGIAIVSSVAGYGGLPTSLLYGATKAALINFAETLYLDLQPKGISVYLINPGFVKTPLTDKNEFEMPALISAEEAAREIVAGLERGEFEIHFPKRFTRVLKLLQLLPYRAYFAAVRRFTGL
ncbi:MAG: SDR family NAD(P)-dependent oxidoreductase [Burkholderiales bacterium]